MSAYYRFSDFIFVAFTYGIGHLFFYDLFYKNSNSTFTRSSTINVGNEMNEY